MATFEAISATGKTIERLLAARFAADEAVSGLDVNVALVRTEDFDTSANIHSPLAQTPALSVFLYSVEPNGTMRAAWSAVGSQDGHAHLPLDLHYLLTPWAENAEHEQTMLGSALACIDTTPIATGPLLYPSAAWAPTEAVQLLLDEMPIDQLARVFDSLQSDFKLSVSLLARVIRIDGGTRPVDPVTTVIVGESVL
jgi:Pvc16 N-terminal domain